MDPDREESERIDDLLQTPDLAGALDNEQFRTFLNQVPIAIAASRLDGRERIIFANPAFERLTGLSAAELANRDWDVLVAEAAENPEGKRIGEAIKREHDRAGTFRFRTSSSEAATVDVYSNIIQDDDGAECFRLVALVDITAHGEGEREEFERRIREKDVLLRELQHRVKNNLQMITALIRLEARTNPGSAATSFDRLAGRVNSLTMLYDALAQDGGNGSGEVDLGVYLGQIASAVMTSNATEGITLDMKLDSYPLSVNVAMPCGLVVNELLTNSLKHAFVGREGGTIVLRSQLDGDGCRVVVADDGVGLPHGATWPHPGKLGALIVQSLRENADAEIEVKSHPGSGMAVTIIFRRSAAVAIEGRPAAPTVFSSV
jgi:PAS domain S-box-containing protein